MQAYWKLLVEHLYQDFIDFFLPDWTNKIDFSRPATFLNLPESVVAGSVDQRQENLVIGLRFQDQQNALLLFCLERTGYENKNFGEQLFKDHIATLEEVEFKIPTATFVLFLANSLPYRHEQYSYEFAQTNIQMTFAHYIVREQYLDDLWEMVNPIAFAVAACRLRLENERHPKGRFDTKKVLVQKLLERFIHQRINIDAVSALLQFILPVLDLSPALEMNLRDETKAFIANQNTIGVEQKAILLQILSGKK
ncbi:MAG: hypothetical protein AAF849_02345 [Bacteroidota bacterium]